jgi:hypothetical protein
MDRLLTMDRERYIAQMQDELRQMLGKVADAVNNAPDGNVINGSEVEVRDLMAQFRQKAFEKALQMRIDSTESSFSPSQGRQRGDQTKQGAVEPEHAERQRAVEPEPDSVARRGRRKRLSGGPPAGPG